MTWDIRPGLTYEIAAAGGEQIISDDDGLTAFTTRKIPWDVIDQLRKLRDARVDKRNEAAQI